MPAELYGWKNSLRLRHLPACSLTPVAGDNREYNNREDNNREVKTAKQKPRSNNREVKTEKQKPRSNNRELKTVNT